MKMNIGDDRNIRSFADFLECGGSGVHGPGALAGTIEMTSAVATRYLARPEGSVVGIVADTRDGGPRSTIQPEVYVPMAQGPGGVFDWIGRQVRSSGSQVGPRPERAPIRSADSSNTNGG